MKKAILIFTFSILAARAQAQTSDIGTQVNNEIASLPTVTQNSQTWAQGTVTIFAGTYNLSTTIVLNSPYVDLRCEPGTILTYTGSGDAIRILPSAQITGAASTQPNQGPSVENCSIYNTSSTAISGIHAGDISKIHLTNVAVNNFNGTATSAGYWFDNTVSFTEGMALTDITSNNNSIAMRFTNTGGNNSFGYTSIRGFRAQVRGGQIGISVETGTFLYHSYIDAIAETADSTGTVMSVSGTGIVGGNQGDDVVFIRGECVNSSGSCTGATLLKLGASTQFVANGFMNALGVTMVNSIATGAVFHWQGTSQQNNVGTRTEWGLDGNLRLVWATNTRLLVTPSNMRALGSSYVYGWAANPTANANFLGISPCSPGALSLCIGNGIYGDSSAAVQAGQIQAGLIAATQFIGNSAIPTIAAGPGAGMLPPAVSLSPSSTSVSGSVSFTTGSSPEASSVAITVTFATALTQAPNVCIPAAQNAATGTAFDNIIINPPTNTGFVISSGSQPLVAATTYQIGYACF